MNKIWSVFLLLCALAVDSALPAQTAGYTVRGRVIESRTRLPVPYAAVVVAGREAQGASTDTAGLFQIHRVPPGILRFVVSCVGYKTAVTPEYRISAAVPFLEIVLEEDENLLESVVVRPSPFPRIAESPVSMQRIGMQEIEKSPGANRDVSRIVQSYPGVAFSPAGYRNDLIVRGGSPSENKFYLDGIEIPNINHFSTQGASGGPVGIVNADLIREIDFFTGAFPADRSGALSSVLDIRLKEGNPDKNRFKATLGASEVSLSGSGHLGKKTTFLASVRRSYLQLLFRMLDLPFLPAFTDGQVKVRTRFSDSDELVLLGLFGLDNMKLNTEAGSERNEYLLGYLPRIRQETFTLGAVYRRYAGVHTRTVTVSHSYLNNRNIKYRNNDESSEANLMLRLRSVEQKSTLRAENKSHIGSWTFREGAEATRSFYTNRSRQRIFSGNSGLPGEAGTASVPAGGGFLEYDTRMGIWGWGLFAVAGYASPNDRFTASAGLRLDGCGFSSRTARFWNYPSPRISLSYALGGGFSINGSSGIYYQLPPYTALGYKNGDNVYVNEKLNYMKVTEAGVGADWRYRDRLLLSAAFFYKKYGNMPLSVSDGIPLACKGDDYGVVGNEALVSSARGRSFGVEIMAKWQIPERVNIVSSLTLFRSGFRKDAVAPYIASAWDNRLILNVGGTYYLPRQWSVGVKVSAIGGAPYTPYDEDKSSLAEAWDVSGRPYYDFALYNTERLPFFAQADLRVDKLFYFRNWMLGLYIDLQNATVSKFRRPDVLVSTGIIDNPEAPREEQRYRMKYLRQESGTLLPTLGITVEF